MEEKKNPLYSGNAFWIYEAFKTVNQDFDFDRPYTDKPQYAKNQLLIYECLMFNDDREYTDFLNMLKRRSVHNYNVDLTPSDKIITLSTCYDNNYKVVLHAKLIKREVIE